ncbi:hypothetical protein GRI89_16945 [Altererythrobacter salegens]|uniref:Uncharacterized protein n=1 Tax=Croceibacterium salegens TaxID=1737568 RepID=A0A6I4SYT7_9SPHN|nr:hypothetical protein [Croceibacterium salegens]MXO61234.1 hypothetical protein [Croceibacterium salegens]
MGKLDSTLADAETMYRKMRSLADAGGTDSKNEIVKLRSRYAMLMLEILQDMKTDARLQADTALRDAFSERFFALRQALADHQAKWRLQAIEDDIQGYLKSAQGLNSVQDDFYRWVGTSFSLH